MSELKSIELLDTLHGNSTSFISLELLSQELDDSLTAIRIIADKVHFILNEMLELSDERPTDNNTMSLIKHVYIANKQRGYTELLADYYQALNKEIEAIDNVYITDVTADKIKEHIEFKEVKTVNYRDNRKEVTE